MVFPTSGGGKTRCPNAKELIWTPTSQHIQKFYKNGEAKPTERFEENMRSWTGQWLLRNATRKRKVNVTSSKKIWDVKE